jgi:hypothetical protein
MNVAVEMSNEDVLVVLRKYGDIKAVMDHPTIPGCRLVEFYDLRHAAEAYQKINSAPGKIPTISEVCHISSHRVILVIPALEPLCSNVPLANPQASCESVIAIPG